jgi:hypothetical protein
MRPKFHLFKLLIIISIGSCITNEPFKINKFKESNPIHQNEKYEFPLLLGNSKISEKINAEIILDILNVDITKKHKSIFENIWSTKGNSISKISFLEYKINTLNKKLYSVTFNTEGCGAYCEEFFSSYNFDLSNGKKIRIDALLTKKGKEELLALLSYKKKKIIEEYLIQLKNESVAEEDKKYVAQTIQLYKNCLKRPPFVTLEYFDFKIINDTLILTSDRCSNHAMRALDDLGDYTYIFKKNELFKLFNKYGKSIL